MHLNVNNSLKHEEILIDPSKTPYAPNFCKFSKACLNCTLGWRGKPRVGQIIGLLKSRIVNEFNLLIYYKSIVIQICDKHKEELACHS